MANIARYNRKVNVALVSSKADMAEILSHRPEGFTVEFKYSEPIFVINIVKRVRDEGRDHVDQIKVVCVKLDASPLYLFVSDYKPALFKSLLLKLVSHNYPQLARIFIRHTEFYQLFHSLKTKKVETIVNRALFYSRDSEDGVQDKDIKWTRRPFEEVFRIVDEQNGWIKKIDFKSFILKEARGRTYQEKKIEGSISSDLHFIFKGDFITFRDYFLDPAIKIAKKRFGYFDSRSESAKDRLPEPIVIKFDEPIFGELDWNERFIDIMADMKNASVTQYHINPYIHVSLVDYQDGSSYGIWIVSDDEINVIPQVRASVASMNRLVNHIYERISEGEVAKYAPLEVGAAE